MHSPAQCSQGTCDPRQESTSSVAAAPLIAACYHQHMHLYCISCLFGNDQQASRLMCMCLRTFCQAAHCAGPKSAEPQHACCRLSCTANHGRLLCFAPARACLLWQPRGRRAVPQMTHCCVLLGTAQLCMFETQQLPSHVRISMRICVPAHHALTAAPQHVLHHAHSNMESAHPSTAMLSCIYRSWHAA